MVNITRVYTRTGDDGSTALGDFSRTRKTDPRLAAYADANEANAAIGIAIAAGDLDEDVKVVLIRIQNDLFDIGADLCTPLATEYAYEPLRVKAEWIDELERDCDEYLERVEKLRSFILPGGSPGSAYLHLATTITRRAERATWAAIEEYGTEPAAPAQKPAGDAEGAGDAGDAAEGATDAEQAAPGGINPLTAKYLNRLSDLLFVLARVANISRGGDILWRPGGGREEPDNPKYRKR
ncbi:MAG: cob(I)yrinic acid a,c-diamide adenosyltransferase [Dermatophilus congolensis]|nr:cob(I)yrinic acid a,c-diamide adenosyltransferase [Dermatophilus congolensis]